MRLRSMKTRRHGIGSNPSGGRSVTVEAEGPADAAILRDKGGSAFACGWSAPGYDPNKGVYMVSECLAGGNPPHNWGENPTYRAVCTALGRDPLADWGAGR